MKSKKNLIIEIILVTATGLIFYIYSQTYSADEQIFITNSYFITPKSQPLLFILMWLVTIGLLIFAVYLGKLVTVFLFKKGFLFEIVGVFLLIMAGVLGYQFLFVGEDVKTTSDFIIVLIMLLFPGGFGLLMIFNKFIQKHKKQNLKSKYEN